MNHTRLNRFWATLGMLAIAAVAVTAAGQDAPTGRRPAQIPSMSWPSRRCGNYSRSSVAA